MGIYNYNKENILKAGEILKNGGLVAFPTETVYGLGGDVFNPTAIAKIFEVKKRPFFDPLITHIADMDMLLKLTYINDYKILKLIETFWPGPLTLVLPKKDIVPSIITSGLDTMAIRMPDNNIAIELIKNSSGAIAAPSANPFGYLSPTTAMHVYEQLGEEVDMIIEGGSCRVGVESTVIDMTKKIPIILRPGGLSKEEIEKVIGVVESFDRTTSSPTAPGQLPSHYSPRKPLHILYEGINNNIDFSNSAYLSFKESGLQYGFKKVEILSEKGNMLEAAANLFSCLHKLDKEEVDNIYVEKIDEIGIGKAIMDRLYKASKK